MTVKQISINTFWALAGAALSLLVLELGLRLSPVYNGLTMQATSPQRPLIIPDANQSFIYSSGWSMLNYREGKTNNIGFSNSRDWSGNRPAILVVGDSYIESLMHPYEHTVQGYIEDLLPGVPVYSAGLSAANAVDYLTLIELAKRHIPVSHLVVRLDPSDFRQAMSQETVEVGHGWWHITQDRIEARHRPYQPSRLKNLLRKSALLCYLHKNLGYSPTTALGREWGETRWASPLVAPSETRTAQLPESEIRVFHRITDYFLNELSNRSGLSLDKVVFLEERCERATIYRTQLLRDPPAPKAALDQTGDTTQAYMQYFNREALARGAAVVDVCPAMEDYVKRHHERLDFSPFDMHWNAEGHRIAANLVANVLQERVAAMP